MRKTLLIALGMVIILLGALISPLPGPLGLPVAMVGAIVVLKNSSTARRQFVRWKRRYPRLFAPAMRILRWRRRREAPAAA